MGIPGLARRLEPYATLYSQEQLGGYVAIIDGPALAYHAHKLALAVSSCTARIPSYVDIVQQAIKWLNSLEELNIKVSAILFDGALPESKRAERLSRMEHNVKRIAQLRSSYPTQACPIPTYLGAISYAFLAPALREALAASSFADRTHIVPGEADDWCAVQAQQIEKSIIFTSDTDLVLYHYHDATLVAFLHDADPFGSLSLYSPSQLRERLKVKSLVEFAYVLRLNPSDSESLILRQVQNLDLASQDYVAFSKRYVIDRRAQPGASSIADLPQWLQSLDVRISEFVYQCTSSVTPSSEVHLPLIMEDTSLASAWNMGQDIRTLAYSILSLPRSIVREFKRKAQGIFIHEISTYNERQTEESANHLCTQISTLSTWGSTNSLKPALVWVLFALSLIIPEFNTQPPLLLIVRVLNADFDNTWDFVHLTARIQAALYSLRMIQQIIQKWLSFNENDGSALRKCLLTLNDHFTTFPELPDVISVPGQKANVLANSEELKVLVQEIYTSIGVEAPKEQALSRRKKKQAREADRKKRVADQRQQRKTDGSNVFSLLKQE